MNEFDPHLLQKFAVLHWSC